jgi:hypothetical protein
MIKPFRGINMRITENQLRQLIRKTLLEQSDNKKDLTPDDIATYTSKGFKFLAGKEDLDLTEPGGVGHIIYNIARYVDQDLVDDILDDVTIDFDTGKIYYKGQMTAIRFVEP